jgi:thioredoxin-related protein
MQLRVILTLCIFLINVNLNVWAMSQAPKTKSNIKEKELQTTINTSDASATSLLGKIEVKNSKLQVVRFTDLLKNNPNIILFVKPHCPFCESFLSIANLSKTKIAEKLIVVLDGTNSTEDAFKSKFKSFNYLKNAEWIFDYQGALKNFFKVEAFPQFLIIDAEHKLIHTQKGLIKPANQEELQGKQFGEVLMYLSENTLNWLEKGDF